MRQAESVLKTKRLVHQILLRKIRNALPFLALRTLYVQCNNGEG